MRKKNPSLPRFGNLPPKYRFILNPYKDARFSTCPNCSGKTLVPKIRLLVHVHPRYPTTINKHCRCCPKCDFLIAHNIQEHVHDFKEYPNVNYAPAHWGPAKE